MEGFLTGKDGPGIKFKGFCADRPFIGKPIPMPWTGENRVNLRGVLPDWFDPGSGTGGGRAFLSGLSAASWVIFPKKIRVAGSARIG